MSVLPIHLLFLVAVMAAGPLAAEPGPAEPEPPPVPAMPEDPVVRSAQPLAYAADDPAIDTSFNNRPVPAGDADVKAIQDALQANLQRSGKALVCIEIDGGSGSGVIVTPNGLILSAAHVVMDPGRKLDVVLADGKRVKAETLGLVPDSDAGMARILDTGTYEFVPIADYADLRVGDWCYALGHSGGWDEKRGPVVRIGRILRKKDGTMQSDCKLIGGDSGGPIFDMEGRLIGINSRVGSNVEESLHCPSNVYIEADSQLRRGIVIGQEKPAFFGMTTGENAGVGVKVAKLLKDGPALRDGLKEGDIVLAAGSRAITSKEDFSAAIAGLKAGERLTFKIRRADGKEEEIWVRSTARDGFDIMGL